jgi:adenosylmethionine-8-amino-7-oxononanoate aminotransferase
MVSRDRFYDHLKQGIYKAIPSFNSYHHKMIGESEDSYLSRLLAQFEEVLLELGPDKVAAFVLEPVVGASQGCTITPPGYLKGVRNICDKYGILLIFDEVMCGMGRTGYMHA